MLCCVPNSANVVAPSSRIFVMHASVSTLFTTVGDARNPRWAGKGGRLRGSPTRPSHEFRSADSLEGFPDLPQRVGIVEFVRVWIVAEAPKLIELEMTLFQEISPVFHCFYAPYPSIHF